MKEKEHFLDKNTLISVILVFIAWFAWDAYMRKKYPKKPLPPALSSEESKDLKTPSKDSNFKKPPLKKAFKKEDLLHPRKEKIFSFKSESFSFDISSQGMGFKNVILNQILDRKGSPIWLFSGKKDLPFETRLWPDKALYFDIKQKSESSWEGIALWEGVEIKKTLYVDASRFVVQTKIQVKGPLDRMSGLSTILIQTKKAEPKKGFLSFFIQPDFLSFFLSSSGGFEQAPILSEQDYQELKKASPFSEVQVLATGTKYFGLAWLEESSDVLPQARFVKKEENYVGLINHFVLNPNKPFELSYKAFMGPKDFSFLKKEYPSLIHWVDFGWFSSLSRLILQILHFFYSIVGNWGVSVILLTLLVRLLLLPLVISSHRSMEVMKKAHPEIQKAREKFKKDPQRMNQEVMAIMKSHRANPLGGCLPLLLQIPVFWSLWKALSNSYSLYRAPFVFWIQDLSWKDPYYVLPVLMGVFMFIQQKISPVTMNKEMLKAMQIMPIFMVFFMINLPSGLVLYMLVSTVFGLAQQVYLNKKNKVSSTSKKLEENKKKGK